MANNYYFHNNSSMQIKITLTYRKGCVTETIIKPNDIISLDDIIKRDRDQILKHDPVFNINDDIKYNELITIIVWDKVESYTSAAIISFFNTNIYFIDEGTGIKIEQRLY